MSLSNWPEVFSVKLLRTYFHGACDNLPKQIAHPHIQAERALEVLEMCLTFLLLVVWVFSQVEFVLELLLPDVINLPVHVGSELFIKP